MRIGIDGHVLGKNVGGVERFVRELVNQLPEFSPQHEYIVFVTKSEYSKLLQSEITKPSRVKYVPLAFANPLIERLILLPWLVYRHQLDALLVQRLAPWFCGRCKLIATIHDLTPIKFADAYKGLSNMLVRLLTKNTIHRASLILTPTETIKAEIARYCEGVTAPIVAFYNGVDAEVFKKKVYAQAQKLPLNSPYILTVGAIEKRKNLETIFNMLPLLKQHSDIQLAIVGGVRDATYFSELEAQLVKLGLLNRVQFLGFMDEDALIHLYQNAAVFITASRDEGFNIPPLEAMACGTPVVCSDIDVHRELFDGAALFCDPLSSEDFAQNVMTVLNDHSISESLVEKGYSKVSDYTWQQTAINVSKAFKLLEA